MKKSKTVWILQTTWKQEEKTVMCYDYFAREKSALAAEQAFLLVRDLHGLDGELLETFVYDREVM